MLQVYIMKAKMATDPLLPEIVYSGQPPLSTISSITVGYSMPNCKYQFFDGMSEFTQVSWAFTNKSIIDSV